MKININTIFYYPKIHEYVLQSIRIIEIPSCYNSSIIELFFHFAYFYLCIIKMREREREKMENSERKNTVKRVFNRNSRDDSLTSDFERRKSGSKVRSFRELIFRDDAASKSKTYSTLFVRESPRVSRSWTSTLRVPVSICGLRSRSNENSTFRSLIHDAISRPSN